LGVGLYRKGNEASLLEPAHLQRFLSHFEVDCVFDVGANEGQYARQLRAIGYGGLILSFEPHPEVYERLAIAAKDDLLWHTFHLALDAQVRQLDFHLMASSQFSSLHAPSTAGTDQLADLNRVVQKVSLTTATLNDLLPKLRETHGFKRPYLKLDTQGHDKEVVRGGLDVMGGFVGLQSELAITKLYENSPDFAESLQFYRSLGFSLSAFVPNNQGHFPDLLEIDCIMYGPLIAQSSPA
jgi:FkbM family methyltransferase